MNVVQAFLDEHRDDLGLDNSAFTTLVLTPRFRASSHVVFLVFARGATAPSLVAKLPRLLDGPSTLSHEAASLNAIQRLRPGGFESVPKLIAFEPFQGRPLLIETALTGPLMDPRYVRGHVTQCCRAISDWLAVLHRWSALASSGDWFTALVEEPLARFTSRFPLTREELVLVQQTREIAKPLAAASLPFVFEHGDLSHPNVVLTGADSVGVLDWELARRRGAVAHDLFVFLAYVAFSRSRAERAPEQAAAACQAFEGPQAWARPVAINYAKRLNIDTQLLRPLFVLCWARYTATLLERLHDAPPSSGVISSELANWVRHNRYYRLWQLSTRMADAGWV